MPKLVYNARAQDAIAADLARDGDHEVRGRIRPCELEVAYLLRRTFADA